MSSSINESPTISNVHLSDSQLQIQIVITFYHNKRSENKSYNKQDKQIKCYQVE